VTPEQIKPLLHAARSLMNAIGKAQVELAAGGLAVALVSPQAPLHSALRHGDQGLHQLAKAVLAAGRRIEDLEGLPYDQVESGEVDEAIRELRVAAATLDSLREWALGAMAGAVDA
jgi:phosphohistidine phosphatase SixA